MEDKSIQEAAAAVTSEYQHGKLIGSMLDVYLRGGDGGGDERPRAARLVEVLYYIAVHGENDRTRLAAIQEIMDRVDGKVIERKEIKKMQIDGIVYIPKCVEEVRIEDMKRADK
jgi:hypothetical protein